MSASQEDREQIALVNWAMTKPLLKQLLLAIPNGGDRKLVEAKKLQRMGVRKGVSDLQLPLANFESASLWLELKVRNRNGNWGRLTAEQKTWLNRMRCVGNEAHVAYGCEHGITLLCDYVANSKWSLYDELPY